LILVTDATGYVGSAVARRLLSQGLKVAAMVRHAGAAGERLPPQVTLRVADYEDISALRSALAGADQVILISSDGDARAVMRHHANIISAATAASLRHITFTSIIDVERRSPFYYAPVYRDAKPRLEDSSVPSTIVRCSLYSDFILKHWLTPRLALTPDLYRAMTLLYFRAFPCGLAALCTRAFCSLPGAPAKAAGGLIFRAAICIGEAAFWTKTATSSQRTGRGSSVETLKMRARSEASKP
jgi:hypothetical protein